MVADNIALGRPLVWLWHILFLSKSVFVLLPFLVKIPMSFDHAGFDFVENVLSDLEVEHLAALLSALPIKPQRGGIRRIETLLPEVDRLAKSSKLLAIAQPYLDGEVRLVRAIYFIKSRQQNWAVPWHQDCTVAVSERFEQKGWEPWSQKAGVWHVQPPLEVLENMVTVRLHLDATTTENGCLKIAASSHRQGLLVKEVVRQVVASSDVKMCEVKVGGALVMRPHVLHASEKLKSNGLRRVLHFEYSGFELPQGIAWAS